MLVLVAGVLMNIILAGILLSVGFMIGLPQSVDGLDDSIKIKEIRFVSMQFMDIQTIISAAAFFKYFHVQNSLLLKTRL